MPFRLFIERYFKHVLLVMLGMLIGAQLFGAALASPSSGEGTASLITDGRERITVHLLARNRDPHAWPSPDKLLDRYRRRPASLSRLP